MFYISLTFKVYSRLNILHFISFSEFFIRSINKAFIKIFILFTRFSFSWPKSKIYFW